MNPPARTPSEILIDRAVRCVGCGAPLGGCGCHAEAAPTHGAAEKAASVVADAVLAAMRKAYPEPMRHASGGLAKTLRETIRHEAARALLRASGHAPTEEQERQDLAETQALLDRFMGRPGSAT